MLLFLVSSCKKDVVEEYNGHSDDLYVNQKVGFHIIYKVHEIRFDDFSQTVDTLDYELMEYNESIFKDNTGMPGVRIDRYTRNTPEDKWEYYNTWYSVTDRNMAQRVEDNKRYIKLSFPMSKEAVWNSNSLNQENAVNVYYGILHKRTNLDTFVFPSAVSVESTSVNNIFREREFREIYAKNIGLVYKNIVNIDKNNSNKRGYKITYTLKDYHE